MQDQIPGVTEKVLAHVAPSRWAELHKFDTTIVEVDADLKPWVNRSALAPRPAGCADCDRGYLPWKDAVKSIDEMFCPRCFPPPKGPRTIRVARYLGRVVWKAEPDDEDCRVFGKAIDALVERRKVLGYLMAPIAMKLAPENYMAQIEWDQKNYRYSAVAAHDLESQADLKRRLTQLGPRPPDGRQRCMLLAYLFPRSADETNETLNAFIGVPGFIDEGRLPAEW